MIFFLILSTQLERLRGLNSALLENNNRENNKRDFFSSEKKILEAPFLISSIRPVAMGDGSQFYKSTGVLL